MKDNLEKVKDILYNISDYLIMGTIIIVIGLIISWRLDILFPDTNIVADINATVKAEDSVSKDINKPADENVDKVDKENEAEVLPVKDTKAEETPKLIKVSIPKGSPSTNIGIILVDQGLIASVQDFENKVKELSLEKKIYVLENMILKKVLLLTQL